VTVLDGHESHISVEFDEYCKTHNIVAICLPPHSSHLTQPLDVACFGVLKRNYGYELDDFIKAHITHITKTEFFIAFQAAYHKTITAKNIKAGFRGASLVPFDLQAVISKLDVKLQTSTPTRLPSTEPDSWVSQTPNNPTEMLSQTELVKNKIAQHQGSSPTSIFTATTKLVKGTEVLAHRVSLLVAKVDILQKANEALSKRKRAKKTHVHKKGAISAREAIDILAQKEVDKQIHAEKPCQGRGSEAGLSTTYHCGKCGKTGYNARTCQTST
jgi:hypothetical protein